MSSKYKAQEFKKFNRLVTGKKKKIQKNPTRSYKAMAKQNQPVKQKPLDQTPTIPSHFSSLRHTVIRPGDQSSTEDIQLTYKATATHKGKLAAAKRSMSTAGSKQKLCGSARDLDKLKLGDCVRIQPLEPHSIWRLDRVRKVTGA